MNKDLGDVAVWAGNKASRKTKNKVSDSHFEALTKATVEGMRDQEDYWRGEACREKATPDFLADDNDD